MRPTVSAFGRFINGSYQLSAWSYQSRAPKPRAITHEF
jgi:hypothetical protein